MWKKNSSIVKDVKEFALAEEMYELSSFSYSLLGLSVGKV